MSISIDFWHAVGYLLSFLGFCFGFAKLLLAQYSNRLESQFKTLESHMDKLILTQEKQSEKVIQLERDLLTLKGEMPLQYVRREDFVRNQTVIEAKLDALALKIEKFREG